MRKRRLFAGAAVFWLTIGLAAISFAQKKSKDDYTQTLELPRDPPAVALGETRRLVFHVSPLSGKGLLTQQTRDALRAILKQDGNLQLVHVRAFVAGSGDVRRIPQIVSEVATEKKMPLPSVSVLRAGGLPMENAQVVLETVSIGKRDTNSGLDFAVTEAVTDPNPETPVKPLLDKALAQFSMNAGDVLKVTCFVSSIAGATELTRLITARFPAALVDLVQPQRGPFRALAACETISKGQRITAPRLAFTGTRVAFGAGEKEATLAFQRLDRDLTEAGSSAAAIALTNLYPLSTSMAELARRLRPSSSPTLVVPFEGLASIDAGFAVDAIATVSP